MPELDPTIHRRLGIDLFNLVWDYLEKPERTQQEDDSMLNAAHASRYHWEQVGTALNLARGEWQLSRVYATLRRSEPALYHAQRSLEICEANGIGDFDLAFAFEAKARAMAIAGQFAECRTWLERARQAAQNIQEADDREWLEENLESVPSDPGVTS